MKKLIFLLLPLSSLAQPWTADGICDFTDGVQWNNGGAKGCACTWYSLDGTLNCAFGDCGQNALYECAYDCNGHNGFATDQTPRQCDATADPICWFNGAGSAGQLFCEGLDALPIELDGFYGYSVDGYNFIEWETASEFENSYFELSYSEDGVSWVVICDINGAGTTTEPQSYRFMHMNAKIGINYYRLRQYDFNGNYSESDVISIRKEISTDGLFSDIYPNPSSRVFFFNYNGNNTSDPITVEVISLDGKQVLYGQTGSFNNYQGISMDVSGVPKGVYTVNIEQLDNVEIKRIVIN
jgi:hypothetical protein